MSNPSNSSISAKKKYSDGIKSLKKNSLIEAEILFAEAIAEDENFGQAWLQLGIVWGKMGRNQEAREAFQMAVALNDKDVDSLYNYGLSLLKSGNETAGLPYLKKASEYCTSSEIADSIGDAFYNAGDYRTSSLFYLDAYKKDKNKPKIKHKLAISLYQEGDISSSIILLRDLLLRFPDTPQYQTAFCDAMNKYSQSEFDADTKKAVEICMASDIVQHKNLAQCWCNSFLLDPHYAFIRNFQHTEPTYQDQEKLFDVLKDPFLCLGLRRIILAQSSIENILTPIRRYFMLNRTEHETWPRHILDFLTSLAIQCWNNDFVYYETPDEKDSLKSLLSSLETKLSLAQKINDSTAKLLALTCCYKPLYEVNGFSDQSIFASSCKTIIAPMVKAQFGNPQYETSLIPKISSFTEIQDETSRAVQKMYEHRPYPRWTSVNSPSQSDTLREISKNIEILVAGCGTGQEPCSYASILPEAKFTAVDLSRPSIAYAMRMAEELGHLNRMTFMHGDLMKVGDLNKKFDFVTSSGVLHHLKEPEKGLKAILDTLKPGGRLSISLYSKYARDTVLTPASEYIKEKNYTSSLDDMRRFRKDILNLPKDDPRRLCAQAGDFYSLSECNDLLFHVQEHRYTFPMIQEMADRHGLTPYHVRLSRELKSQFKEMFPDGQISDLNLMHQFEEKHPQAFLEMYRVHFHRKGEGAPHPLDSLIKGDIL